MTEPGDLPTYATTDQACPVCAGPLTAELHPDRTESAPDEGFHYLCLNGSHHVSQRWRPAKR